MKTRNLLGIICLAAALFSCTRGEKFIADGIVPDTTFEGSKIYLVALDGPLSKKVDSTEVRNGKFRFEVPADSLGVRILRVPARFPAVLEDLVVVTEPGKIDVVLSTSSYGSGTRLNNMLQGWKKDKRHYDSLQFDMYTRSISPAADPQVSDSLMKQSTELAGRFMARIINKMNDNLENGVGLLLFKIYYPSLPAETKKRVLGIMGDTYMQKDLQLWSMVKFDQDIPK